MASAPDQPEREGGSQDGLNRPLLDRLSRPLYRPGVIAHDTSQRILARVQRMSLRSPLLERLNRQIEPIQGVSLPQRPIVYAPHAPTPSSIDTALPAAQIAPSPPAGEVLRAWDSALTLRRSLAPDDPSPPGQARPSLARPLVQAQMIRSAGDSGPLPLVQAQLAGSAQELPTLQRQAATGSPHASASPIARAPQVESSTPVRSGAQEKAPLPAHGSKLRLGPVRRVATNPGHEPPVGDENAGPAPAPPTGEPAQSLISPEAAPEASPPVQWVVVPAGRQVRRSDATDPLVPSTRPSLDPERVSRMEHSLRAARNLDSPTTPGEPPERMLNRWPVIRSPLESAALEGADDGAPRGDSPTPSNLVSAKRSIQRSQMISPASDAAHPALLRREPAGQAGGRPTDTPTAGSAGLPLVIPALAAGAVPSTQLAAVGTTAPALQRSALAGGGVTSISRAPAEVGSSAAAAPDTAATTAGAVPPLPSMSADGTSGARPEVDIERVTDQVYQRLVRRLVHEREQRGW